MINRETMALDGEYQATEARETQIGSRAESMSREESGFQTRDHLKSGTIQRSLEAASSQDRQWAPFRWQGRSQKVS